MSTATGEIKPVSALTVREQPLGVAASAPLYRIVAHLRDMVMFRVQAEHNAGPAVK
jgi:hypothetical protein